MEALLKLCSFFPLLYPISCISPTCITYVESRIESRNCIGKLMHKLRWSACAQLGVPRSLINKGDPNKRALRRRGRLTYLPPGQRMQQNYGAEHAACITTSNKCSIDKRLRKTYSSATLPCQYPKK